jgi:acyl-phosphate glycerol 3-phosphate acyltransferase
MTIIFILGEFLSGSLMFSYWLGLIANKNIKEIGDGNPGAANLWKAAGSKYGITGVLLDFLKGYFPLAFLIKNHFITGYEIIPVALAPIFGHAFSPFLKCQGGKAIAVTFGVWSALTNFKVSLIYAAILALLQIGGKFFYKKAPSTPKRDGLQTTFGFILLGLYIYVWETSDFLIWIWAGNLLIFVLKNRLI